MSLRNVIPFMAFVSLLIALVQETALGSLIAHALTPLANSLWGLVLLSLICGIPFLSPVLGPGAAISQVIGVSRRRSRRPSRRASLPFCSHVS